MEGAMYQHIWERQCLTLQIETEPRFVSGFRKSFEDGDHTSHQQPLAPVAIDSKAATQRQETREVYLFSLTWIRLHPAGFNSTTLRFIDTTVIMLSDEMISQRPLVSGQTQGISLYSSHPAFRSTEASIEKGVPSRRCYVGW